MIPHPQFFIDRVNLVVNVTPPQINTVQEARIWIKQLIQMQKELRQLKKELNAVQKQIRTDAKIASQNAGQELFANIITSSILGKQTTKSINAKAKRDAANSILQHLAPYESIEHYIDQTIVTIDSNKVSIETWILQQSS